ncbi:MAG: helix-turn-helix domain-containing protein [Acidobacteriota bacterium]|nr:helix-turn-helix domain-containing protein [Acidobacteriota bacterium]
MNEVLMDRAEVAKQLGVAPITVMRLQRQGRLDFYRIGARVLCSESHIRSFLKDVEQTGKGDDEGGYTK